MTYLQWYKAAPSEDKAAVQSLKAEECERTGLKIEARDIILGIMTEEEKIAA